jgi:hypothetical protein
VHRAAAKIFVERLIALTFVELAEGRVVAVAECCRPAVFVELVCAPANDDSVVIDDGAGVEVTEPVLADAVEPPLKTYAISQSPLMHCALGGQQAVPQVENCSTGSVCRSEEGLIVAFWCTGSQLIVLMRSQVEPAGQQRQAMMEEVVLSCKHGRGTGKVRRET